MNTVERILSLIKEKNINQVVLAKAIGVSAGNISDWKTGKANPSYGAIVKLANYFNVSTDYLLCKTDDPSPVNTKKSSQDRILTEDEEKIVNIMNSIPKEYHEEIVRLMEAAVKLRAQK